MKVRSSFSLLMLSLSVDVLLSAETEVKVMEYNYITPRDAMNKALQQNLDLKLEKISQDIEEQRISLEESKFGTVLRASYQYEQIDRPQNYREFISTGGGSGIRTEPRIFNEENHRADIKLVTKLEQGQTIEFGTEMRILRNDLNRQVAPAGSSIYYPEYETFTGLTIIQPLGQGFGKKANTHLIKSQAFKSDAAKILFKVKSLATAADTLRKYNSLYYSVERYNKMKVALSTVTEQHKVYEDLFESNKITLSEMLESEAFLFQVEEELAKEKNSIKEKEILLLHVLGEPNSKAKFIPSTPIYDGEPILSQSEYVTMARKNRLDSQYYNKLIKASESQLKDAKDKTKPMANLILKGGYNGLAGSYRDSLEASFNEQAPEFSVGLEFQMSLTKSTAKVEEEIAKNYIKANQEKHKQSQSQAELEVIAFWRRVQELIGEQKVFDKRAKVLDEMVAAQEELVKQGEGTTKDLIKLKKEQVRFIAQEVSLDEELSNAFINLKLASSTLLN